MKILVTRNFDKTDPIGYLTLQEGIDIPPDSEFALGYRILERASNGTVTKIQVQEVSLVSKPALPVMSIDNRDTHFRKFAELLLEDLGDDVGQLMDETASSGDYEGHMRQIIAQHHYKFACYIVSETIGGPNPERVVDGIPDLTA